MRVRPDEMLSPPADQEDDVARNERKLAKERSGERAVEFARRCKSTGVFLRNAVGAR